MTILELVISIKAKNRSVVLTAWCMVTLVPEETGYEWFILETTWLKQLERIEAGLYNIL